MPSRRVRLSKKSRQRHNTTSRASAHRNDQTSPSGTGHTPETSSQDSRSNQPATSDQGSSADGTIATMTASVAGMTLQAAAVLPPTHVGPTEWEDLPTELHLDILGRLSATELMALHVVGSPFKHLIDVNQESLAKAHIRERKSELQIAIEAFNYSRCHSMFDAVKHWYQQKGRWFIGGYDATVDFADHYTEMRGGAHTHYAKQVATYVRALLWLHSLHDIPDVENGKMGYQASAAHVRAAQFPARFQSSNAAPPDDVDRVMAGELGHLDEFERDDMRDWNSWPIRPLTKVVWGYAHAKGVLDDEQAFLDKFVLAPIQSSGGGQRRGPKVAYCASVRDAEQIKTMMERARTHEISSLEKASILEKVFVW